MINKAVLTIGGLILVMVAARWFVDGDYFVRFRCRHYCAAELSEIEDWAYTDLSPGPTDHSNLDRWLRQHPDQVNRLFSAFCEAPLHTAARFGREDLAGLLISRGADGHVRGSAIERTGTRAADRLQVSAL
jgi:hypothetical protein